MGTINISLTAAFDPDELYTTALSPDIFEEDLKEAITSALETMDISDVLFKHIEIEGLE